MRFFGGEIAKKIKTFEHRGTEIGRKSGSATKTLIFSALRGFFVGHGIHLNYAQSACACRLVLGGRWRRWRDVVRQRLGDQF